MPITIPASPANILISNNPYPTPTIVNITPVTPTGAVGSYEFYIRCGELPLGVCLNPANATWEGSATTVGVFTYTYVCRDSTGTISNAATQTVTIYNAQPLVFGSNPGINAVQGDTISQKINLATNWDYINDNLVMTYDSGTQIPIKSIYNPVTKKYEWWLQGVLNEYSNSGQLEISVATNFGPPVSLYINTYITPATNGGWYGKILEIRDTEFDIVLTKLESMPNDGSFYPLGYSTQPSFNITAINE